MNLTVDVISDVICPWCYIGKRRSEKAVAACDDHQVRVRWLPYRRVTGSSISEGFIT